MSKILKDPCCQSCAMPMRKPEDFGTNADGGASRDYCRFCFRMGAFADPDISLVGMIEKLVTFAPKMNMTEEEARAMANSVIPSLKRWRN
jgi:hypothetical protein